jgi:hypothetical protein
MTIDDQGREIRQRRAGAIRCRCSRIVKLWQETDEWKRCRNVKSRPRVWLHIKYGEPHGFCECGFSYRRLPDGRLIRIDCKKNTNTKG